MLRSLPSDEPVACVYGECDGSTWILDEDTNETRPCRCREQRVRRAGAGGVGTGIGRRFLEVSFDREPIVSLDRAVLRQVRAFILVAKAARDAGRSYAVYPVPRMLAEVKRTFDRDAADNYLGFFRRLCTVDVLVLDDLGAEKPTEWVVEQLYSIVNERWQDRRSIVVTTNVPDPDPEAPLRLLRQGARELNEAVAGGRLDRGGRDELARIVARLEHVTAKVEELDGTADFDPVVRLRRQVGPRTVSRLREICEEPIPVWGEDLRVTARGA
jgi:DNA replication protein DnaC